jgi:hypothetical protein
MSYEREVEQHCQKLEEELLQAEIDSIKQFEETQDIVRNMLRWKAIVITKLPIVTITFVPDKIDSRGHCRLMRIFTFDGIGTSSEHFYRQAESIVNPKDILKGCDLWYCYIDSDILGSYVLKLNVDKEADFYKELRGVTNEIYLEFKKLVKELNLGHQYSTWLWERYKIDGN